MITIPEYFSKYTYSLSKLDDSMRELVKFRKSLFYSQAEFERDGIPKDSVLKFPGFIYNCGKFADMYRNEIYEPLYSDVFTPPRGYLDYEVTVVCGVAPGKSPQSFGESNWLFGPSSEKLHKLLSFSNRWYFTNICKEPFPDNKYSEDLVLKYSESIGQELRWFDQAESRFIFLGSYLIYDQIIKELELTKWLRIKHPSYWCYRGESGMDVECEKIKEFLK